MISELKLISTGANNFAFLTRGPSDKDIPKSAGFRWDRDAGRWTTRSPAVASRLIDYADDVAREILQQHIAATSGAIAASKAVSTDSVIPCGDGYEFLPYQRAGIAFASSRNSVLIADDMGLGKTAQAIGTVNMSDAAHILIVCPASLTKNWAREIGKFDSRGLSVGFATTKEVDTDTNYTITTYDVFSRDTLSAKELLRRNWDILILDEAHYCKNSKAARTKRILGGRDEAGLQARRRIYLTGTPIMARPIELFPLLNSLVPGEFGNYFGYAKRYCGGKEGRFGLDVSGATNLDELQTRLRSTVMIRRMKADVLTELPEKRRQIIDFPADSTEAKAALKAEVKAVEARSRAQAAIAAAKKGGGDATAEMMGGLRSALAEITKARHDTARAKLPLCIDHIREAAESTGKVIIFAHHRDIVDALTAGLSDLGVVSITGATPTDARQGIVDEFQNNPDTRVFIGNIQAAGVGLTLTAASTVIFTELDWTPAAMAQAEDRAHRIGQKSAVLVQYLVLEGSIDHNMLRTLENKQSVIDEAINDSTDIDPE